MTNTTQNKTLYKSAIINEFDSFYYKKLKRSIPEKISKGEIEWIYSYGDKLMARGYKSVFRAVEKIIETKNCDNPYMESEVLYHRCQELYDKYKSKTFWFYWFK